jgi:small subunit ribosomal protein S5
MAEKTTRETRDSKFVDHVLKVRRVTKVTKGGKRFSFAALVVTGDRQGNVGIALGKSKEVSLAIAKATAKARKKMITVALRETTVPYEVKGKHGASRVLIRPASKGTGNIAGGAARHVLDAVGAIDVLAKIFGSANGINAAKAVLNALSKLRSASHIAALRGKASVKDLVKGV